MFVAYVRSLCSTNTVRTILLHVYILATIIARLRIYRQSCTEFCEVSQNTFQIFDSYRISRRNHLTREASYFHYAKTYCSNMSMDTCVFLRNVDVLCGYHLSQYS